jgi:hypothetical protein
MKRLLLVLLAGSLIETETLSVAGGMIPEARSNQGEESVNHTYEAKIRLNGKVTTTQVQASDAGSAKKMVQSQFGAGVTVLSVKRVD